MRSAHKGAWIGSLVLLTGCLETDPPIEPVPIRLATTYSQTGRFAQLGTEMANGYILAVQMINEAGGIDGRPVQLVIGDDESDAANVREAYAGFVSSGDFHALLGPYSSPLTQAAIEVTDSAGMVLVAPMAADPGIWAGGVAPMERADAQPGADLPAGIGGTGRRKRRRDRGPGLRGQLSSPRPSRRGCARPPRRTA